MSFGPAFPYNSYPPGTAPWQVMQSFLGVRELPGEPNRHPWIDEVNRYCGVKLGSPWCCSSFVWCCHKAGVNVPKTAGVVKMWSLVKDRRIETPEEGCAFVHLSKDGKHGHIGFYIHRNLDRSIYTLSANTNDRGSREGIKVGFADHSYDYVFRNGGGFFHLRRGESDEPKLV